MKRKSFLKSIFGAGALLSVPYCNNPEGLNEINHQINGLVDKCKGNMVGFRSSPIDKVKVGLIGIGNRGKTLIQMFDWLIEREKAEIVALCDLDQKNIDYALNHLAKKQKVIPKTFANGKGNTNQP